MLGTNHKPETTTMNTKTKPTEAYTALSSYLESLCEQEDQAWLDCPPDYSYHLEAEDIVRSLTENYSPRRIGFQPFDHLGGDEISAVLVKSMGEEAFSSLILSHAEAEPCDYYTRWNEVGSVPVGETEYQIDVEEGSELHSLVLACTAKELESLRYQGWSHLSNSTQPGSFWIYGNPCDRLIWKLNPETFLEAAEPLLRAAGLTDPDDTVRTQAPDTKV